MAWNDYGYNMSHNAKKDGWPSLISQKELIERSYTALNQYLSSGVEVLHRQNVEHAMYSLHSFVWNADNCYFLYDYFSNDNWPENSDAMLAFYWAAYSQTHYNCLENDNVLGEALATFNVAKYLLLVGTDDMRLKAKEALDELMEIFLSPNSKLFWNEVAEYISILTGTFPVKAFQNPKYDLTNIVDIPHAISLYKILINRIIATKETNRIESWTPRAKKLEMLLGIEYFDSMVNPPKAETPRNTEKQKKKSLFSFLFKG